MKTNLSKYVLFFVNAVQTISASAAKTIVKSKKHLLKAAVITTILFELGSVIPVYAQNNPVNSNSNNAAFSSSDISFSSGWENGITGNGNWLGTQFVSNDRFQLVSSPVRKGQYAARIEVRPGDDPINDTGERSEVYAMVDPSGNLIMEDENSGTQYYAFSVMLDSNWQAPSDGTGYWSIVFQLHGPNSLNTSPMFALNAMDGYYAYLYAGDIDSDATSVGKGLMLSDDSLNRGHWVDWVVKIKYAKTATGSVSIWRRNEGAAQFTQVFNEDNLPTLQYKSSMNGGAVEGHYWKHGLYRPKGVSATNVLWLDGMTRGTSFDAVITEAFPSGSVSPTATAVPPTATSVPPTATAVPPTATSIPPTATAVPPTATSVPPTATSVPPTATSVPPTATAVPPTAQPTIVPPTATSVPPTATSVPPTTQPTVVPTIATFTPPTKTAVPPTAQPTVVPTIATFTPPTKTAVPPTAQPTIIPPTAQPTVVPPTKTAVPPTATPAPTQTPAPASKAVISSFKPSFYTIKPGRNLTLNIIGRNFSRTDQVLWGEVLLPIRYISSRSLQVIIPFKSLSAGNVSVSVVSSGAYSIAKSYKVYSPVAKISKLSPSKPKVNTAFTLTVKGSDFLEGSVVTWNGVALNTQFVNNKTLIVSVPADVNKTVTSSSRKIKVSVINPPPSAKKPASNTSLRVTQ